MTAAKAPVATKKLVHSATESSRGSAAKRVRLSKVLAAKPVGKFAKLATPLSPAKPNGAKQLKPVSDRYKMPGSEYAQLGELKLRLQGLGLPLKRSELLRAGLMLLVAMDDTRLKKAVAKVLSLRNERAPTKTAR